MRKARNVVMVALMLLSFNVLAQLDTVHYVAPMYASDHSWTYPGEQAVYVSTPSTSPVNYTIYDGADNVLQTGTVSNANPVSYVMNGFGTDFVVDENDLHKVLTDRGIRVSADQSVYVNVRARSSNGSQGTSLTCKGQAGFGKSFRIGHYPSPQTSNTNKSSTFGIIATEDNTTIDVDLTNNPVTLHGAGAPNTSSVITISLNKGESYVFAIENPDGPNNDGQGMIGGKITSNKDVVVNTGSWGGNLINGNSTDVGIDQIVGEKNIGNEFVVVRGQSPNDDHEQVMIVAEYDNTDVYVNGVTAPVAHLNAGQYHLLHGTYFVDDVMYVKTSKNSYVYQFMMGSTSSAYNTQGMNFIPPITCGSANSVDNIPDIQKIATKTYGGGVTIVTMKGSTVLVNGAPPSATAVEALGSNYEAYKILGLTGDVSVSSNTIALVGFFGASGAAGYGGFYSGFDNVAVKLDWVCAPGYAEELTKRYDTYQWFKDGVAISGATKDSLYITQPGSYSLEYTLGFCKDTSQEYIVPEPSDIQPLGQAKFCEGESVTLSVGNTKITNVQWSTGDAGSTTVSASGKYIVTATDTTGCALKDSIDITKFQYPTVSITANPDTICTGGVSIITASSNADSSWWSGGGTGTTFNATTGGQHIFFGKNGGVCTRSDTVNLIEIAVPTLTLNQENASVCQGDSATVSVTGDFDNLIWNDGSTSTSRTFKSTGEYIVTAWKNGKCSVKDTFKLTVNSNPNPTISSSKPAICGGETITLSTGAYNNYAWSNGGNGSSININDGAWYKVTVTDANGCSGVDSIQMSTFSNPIVNLSDATICANQSHEFDAGNAGSSFVWSNNSTQQKINVNQAGKYIVTVTDGNNCSAMDSAILTVNTLPSFIIDSKEICSGDSPAELGPDISGVSYKWSTTATSKTITTDVAGSYWLEITDVNGCVGKSTGTLTVNSLPSVSLADFANVCANDGEQTLSGGSPTGGSYSGTGISNGKYMPGNIVGGSLAVTYSYTDGNGCAGSATKSISIDTVPIVSFNGDKSLCVDAGDYTIIGGSPSGGVYAGTGVNNGVFEPDQVGVGDYNIVYTFSDGNGCSNLAYSTISVKALPNVAVSALSGVCVNADSIQLSNGTPVGGKYTGQGISNGWFNPAVAGVGIHTVTYSYSDGECSANASTSIEVYGKPTVIITNATSALCENGANYTLTSNIQGGAWLLNGQVFDGILKPSELTGINEVMYGYADGNGCVSSDTIAVAIKDSNELIITGVKDLCLNDGDNILNVNLSGGTWKLNGSNFNGTISPASLSTGSYSVTYNYINGDGCSSFYAGTFDILDTLQPSISSIEPICKVDGDYVLASTPNGGTWLLDGLVNSGTLIPSSLNYGSHTLIYSVQGSNSCSAKTSTTFQLDTMYQLDLTGVTPKCIYDAASTLEANTSVGFWSNNGQTVTEANPLDLGVGNHSFVFTSKNGACTSVDSISVTVNATPVIDELQDFYQCKDIDTVLSLSSWLSQNSGATLKWWTGGTASTASLTGATNEWIWVKVKSAEGCEATDSAYVKVPHTLNPYILSTGSTCSGDSVLVSSTYKDSTQYSFSWNTGQNTTEIYAKTGGEHTLTITDGYGCSYSASKEIMINDNPTVETTNDTICDGEKATLKIANPNSSYLYIWEGGAQGSECSPTQTGYYTVSALNPTTGCTTSDSAYLLVKMVPAFSLGPDTNICEGQQYTVIPDNYYAGATYAWKTGETDNKLNVTQTNTYELTMLLDGCSYTDAMFLNVNAFPSIDLGPDTNVCLEWNHIIDAGYGFTSYEWSSGETTQQITPKTTGTYRVTVGNNGCKAQEEVYVLIVPNPEFSWEQSYQFCQGDSAVVDIAGFQSYSWSDGDTSDVRVFKNEGNYNVTVYNAHGCVAKASTSVLVTLYPVFQLPEDTTLCMGDTFKIDLGVAMDYYEWNGEPKTDSKIEITEAGEYIFRGMNDPMCYKEDTITIGIITLPTNFLPSDTALCFREEEQPLTLLSSYDRATSYSWNTGDSTYSTQVSAAGEYELTMTIGGQCDVKDTVLVESDCIFSIYVPNAFTPNDDGLNENFHVKGNNIEDFYFEIYSRWGETLFTSYSMNDGWNGRYKGRLVQQDVYVWRMTYSYTLDSGRRVQKLKFGTVTVIR